MEFMCDLERTQQTFVKQFVGWQTCYVLSCHRDAPRCGGQYAGNHVKQCRFASTIWTNQTCDRSLFDFKRCPIHCMEAAKMFMKVFNLDHGWILSPIFNETARQSPGC